MPHALHLSAGVASQPWEMRGKTLITLWSNTLVIEAWDELLRVSEFDPT